MNKLTLIVVILSSLISLPLHATIINVPDDYPTIQEGIDACYQGDTVVVANGIYYENIIIQTPISLIGENRDSTIIDGSGIGNVITIAANAVCVMGISIRSSGTDDIDSGIDIDMSDSCRIEICRIYNNDVGINLDGSSFCLISQCIINMNSIGVCFPWYSWSNDEENHIYNNKFEANWTGMDLQHQISVYYRIETVGNLFSNGTRGISMILSREHIISYNEFSENSSYAIRLSMCGGGGEDNNIYINNFVDNNNGYIQATDEGFGNDYWYFPPIGPGNYWSDYNGPDSDSNGIGDIPYLIDGEDQSEDLYPLMDILYAGIEGEVTDHAHEPIEGVIVQAIESHIVDTTDSEGRYYLDNLSAGNYDILFSHMIYQDTIVYAAPTTLNHQTTLSLVMNVVTDISDKEDIILDRFTLLQNYPNPFNPSTSIRYSLPTQSDVRIEIYNILGQKIATLFDGNMKAGYHTVAWQADHFPSGVYFARLEIGTRSENIKMVLLK